MIIESLYTNVLLSYLLTVKAASLGRVIRTGLKC